MLSYSDKKINLLFANSAIYACLLFTHTPLDAPLARYAAIYYEAYVYALLNHNVA